MTKTLGIDLGTNSIGWAIVDKDANKAINFGTRIYPSSHNIDRTLARQQRRIDDRLVHRATALYKHNKLDGQINPIILTLVLLALTTAILTILNFSNWQFWLNLSLAIFVAALSLLYQGNKK